MTRPKERFATLVSERSLEVVEERHLRRLAKIAISDLQDFFRRYPDTGELYRNRRMLICLCQGAARHFVRQGHGVKDFEVWTFFRKHPEKPFPYRRHPKKDFGHSRFGRHPPMKTIEGVGSICLAGPFRATMDNRQSIVFANGLQTGKARAPVR